MEESSSLFDFYWKDATPPIASVPKSSPPVVKEGSESDDEGPFFDLEFTLVKETFDEEDNKSKNGDGVHNEKCNLTTRSPEIREIRTMLASDYLIFERRPIASFRVFFKCNAGEVPAGSLFPGEDSAGVLTLGKKESTVSKVVVRKCFSKIKPLYLNMSKKYTEKLRLPSKVKELVKVVELAVKTVDKCQKPALPAKRRLAFKHLGKSKSASSAVSTMSPSRRSDQSLLVQQDGIQSAIAHCKRSSNAATKETELLRRRSESDIGAGSKGM